MSITAHPPRAQRLHRQSHDPETGLSVRSTFMERGGGELRRARRNRSDLAVALLEAQGATRSKDGFMQLAMLAEEAGRLGIDVVARTGPWEIGLLLPDTSLVGAMHVLNRLSVLAEATPVMGDAQHQVLRFRGRSAALVPQDTRFAQMVSRCR